MDVVIRRAIEEDKAQLQRFPSGLAFLGYELLVAATGVRVLAFLAWRRVAELECEILQFETDPEFRRRGIGRALLQGLKKQEQGNLFLEVRASNHAALELYRNEGFSQVSVRRKYYSFPDEDALVLQFHPC